MQNSQIRNRRCSCCKQEKPATTENFGFRFNGKYWKSRCRECERKKAKEFREKNPGYKKGYYNKNKEEVLRKNREAYWENKERRNEKQKEWYQKNKEKRLRTIKGWKDNNRELNLRFRREIERKYRKESFKHALSGRISASMRRYLRNGKEGKAWIELVDFTPEQLAIHIESLFKPGMTWDNRNKWHIDHIKPISAFNFENTDDPEFKECWSLNNLQPMWASDNIRKSNHYVE